MAQNEKSPTQPTADSSATSAGDAIDTLLQAAVLAPSGDNTQPWRFDVDRQQWCIAVSVDPLRDRSPMNAGQRMAWIAIGAAIENMVRTAAHNGWRYTIEQASDGRVLFKLSPTTELGEVEQLIKDRVTNRKVYDRGPLEPTHIQRLQATEVELDGVSPRWVFDRELLDRLSQLIARGDALMLGTKLLRDAFLAKVRFDKPATAVVDDGLSLGSIEATRIEQIMLRVLRFVPDQVLRPVGGAKLFSGVASKLAGSASGMCLVSSPDDSFASQVAVGRVWQQCWLAATSLGLACQPMMSLCVLRNVRSHAPEVLDLIGNAQTQTLLKEFEQLFETLSPGQPAAMMRIGRAPAPTARTGRLEL